MAEHDPLAAACAALRAAVSVCPPGVEAARRTVARRRRVRRIAAAVAAVAALVVLTATAVHARRGTTADQIQPPTATSTPSPDAAREQQPLPPPVSGTRTGHTPTCTRYGMADVLESDNTRWVTIGVRVTAKDRPLCPSERVRVFWASYFGEPGRSELLLYRSQTFHLDRTRPTVRFRIELRSGCAGGWYVVRGNAPVARTMWSSPDAYGASKLLWESVSGPACAP